MKLLYSWFFKPDSTDSYMAFVSEYGYFWGTFVLFFMTTAIAVYYYLILGNRSKKYIGTEFWFFFLLGNAALIWLLTVAVVGFASFKEESFFDISPDVWVFGIINGGNALWLFVLMSAFLRRWSKHARYSPFPLKK